MASSALVYRTQEDLRILRSVVGHRAPHVEIPVAGEPPLGAVLYRGLSPKQVKRLKTLYASHPDFAHQTKAERLKAGLLVELLKRQDTGRYYRPVSKDSADSGVRPTYWDKFGEQAKDADADAAYAYMKQRGLMHGFRTVRRAFGPGVVAVVAADGVFEGRDYFHFGFRSEEACQAAFKAMNSYQEQVEREAENKPWQLLVAGLEHKGRRRWLIVAAGAFILTEYTIRMPDGTLLGAASLRFDTREEARAAATAIRSTPEYNSKMKLLLVGFSSQNGLLTEEVVG